MSPMTLMLWDDDTDQEINVDKRKDSGDGTLSSYIEEDRLDDHQWEVLLLRQVLREKALLTTRFPLPKQQRSAVLSFNALHFQIPKIQLRQCHHHCSHANSQPSSTPLLSLMVQPPRCSHYSSPLETRILHNQRPVDIRIFTNTKWLRWR